MDLGLKIRKSGKKIIFQASSAVYHYFTKTPRKPPTKRTRFLAGRNRALLIVRNYRLSYRLPLFLRVATELYPSPRPTPPWVGHTYVTYQPLMPHELLYPHKRTYVRRNPDAGFTKTTVRYRRCWLDAFKPCCPPRPLPSPPLPYCCPLCK